MLTCKCRTHTCTGTRKSNRKYTCSTDSALNVSTLPMRAQRKTIAYCTKQQTTANRTVRVRGVPTRAQKAYRSVGLTGPDGVLHVVDPVVEIRLRCRQRVVQLLVELTETVLDVQHQSVQLAL